MFPNAAALERVIAAREELAAGDHLAADSILGDLEHDLASAARGAGAEPLDVGVACEACDRWFRWPGLRDSHECAGEGREAACAA
jgi:hypothetical protein